MNSKVYNNLRLELHAMAEPDVTVNEKSSTAAVPSQPSSRCTISRDTTPEQLRRLARNSLAEAASFEALALQAEREQDEKRVAAVDALALEFCGFEFAGVTERERHLITALYEARNPEAKS